MKNITVSVDEETYRLSCARAARLGTSVSALVREYLNDLVRQDADGTGSGGKSGETECERRRDLLNEVLADFDARGVGLSMADNLPRDVLHDRSPPC